MSEEFDPNDWVLSVIKVSNGYILYKHNEEGAADTIVLEDDDKDDLSSGENLLWEIMEYFNFSGSKHDKERLRIKREPGESFEEGENIRDV